MTNLIHEIQPTEVYNLGAQSHVQVSFSLPQYTAQVDAVGAVSLRESIRASGVSVVTTREAPPRCLDLHLRLKTKNYHFILEVLTRQQN